jgi:deazaflavin-dependent oxidoreductase (nitroreductase family)
LNIEDEDYCYVTTTGRVTGKPHEVEIWFAQNELNSDTIYILAGGGVKSDWVRNAKKAPMVKVRIGEQHFIGEARIVSDAYEDALARRLLLSKYGPPRYDGDLTDWGRNALPVAIELMAVT